MKKFTAIIVIMFFVLSCENKQKYIDSAKIKLDQGKYNEALVDLALAKNSYNPKIKDVAQNLEKVVKDSMFAAIFKDIPENRCDSLFLQFEFKMNENQVIAHAEKLISMEKLMPKSAYNFTLGYGEFAQNMTIRGYGLEFFIRDYKCKGLLGFKYYLNGLSELEITLFNFPVSKYIVLSDIRTLFENKYGKSQDYSDFYSKEESQYIKYFWRVKNKAIIIMEIDQFLYIVYEDLIVKNLKEKAQKIFEESEKELNKENSKNVQNEI